MNIDIVAGKWKQISGWAMKLRGELTGNERIARAGLAQSRFGINQVRYGVARRQAANQLRDFKYRNRNWDASTD